MKVHKLVIIALFATISVVLGFIKITQMPNGGAVSLYLLPLFLLGDKKGLSDTVLLAIVVASLNLISGYVVSFVQVLFDYFIPLLIISLLPLFKGSNVKYIIGIVVLSIGMLTSYVISGVLFFGVGVFASLAYNATFFIPTIILTSIIHFIIRNRIKI